MQVCTRQPGATYVGSTTTEILPVKNISSNMSHCQNFGGSAAGKVFGVCVSRSTYVCIICTSSTYVLWNVLCRFDNIEGHMLYYLRRLRTNVPADRCR